MSADVNLNNIRVHFPDGIPVELDGALGLGLDDVHVDAGVNGTIDVGLDKIKAEAGIKGNIDLGLNDIKAQAGVSGQLDVGLDDIKAQAAVSGSVGLGLDNLRVRELAPIKLRLSFKPIRIQLPMNYTLSIGLFGIPIFKLSICGEGMAIAEDYVARETERCR